MTPAELQALVAAAAPGARITVVMVEVPGAPAPADRVPKPAPLPPAAGAQATAIAERATPFTSAELADVLRVRPDTVGGWCRSGLLPGATRTGAGWRIPPSAVLAMLAAAAPNGPPSRLPNAHGGPPDVAADGAPLNGTAAPTGGGAPEPDAFDPAAFDSWRPRRNGVGHGTNGANGAGRGR